VKGKKSILLMLLGPGAIFIILFTVLPFIFMFELSFFQTNYISSEFVKLKHFTNTFTDPEYLKVFVSSLIYAGGICLVTTFTPLVFALLAYDTKRWMQNYTKFIFFVPSFTSGVIMTMVWRYIFQPRTGLITYLTGLVGIQPVMWMANRSTAIAGISIMTISGIMGVPLLIYMSSILSINPEVFDAARIDGASRFQTKTRIVIPMLGPSVLLVILITMMSGFFIMETILLMTGGGYGTQTFIFNIFDEGINNGKVGLASARNVIMFFVIMFMVFIKRKVEARR